MKYLVDFSPRKRPGTWFREEAPGKVFWDGKGTAHRDFGVFIESRIDYSEEPVWVTRRGQQMTLQEMGVSHLTNLKSLLLRHIESGTPHVIAFENWIKWCEYELSQRERE